MELHFWTSPFQNTWYCRKPWVRKEDFRWRTDFISSSIPFKMEATCSSSVWQMISKSPLPNPVNLWNPQTCGNEENSPLIQVPMNAFLQSYKICFIVRKKFMSAWQTWLFSPVNVQSCPQGYLKQDYRQAGSATLKCGSGLRGLCSLGGEAFSPIFTSLSVFSKGLSLFWTPA